MLKKYFKSKYLSYSTLLVFALTIGCVAIYYINKNSNDYIAKVNVSAARQRLNWKVTTQVSPYATFMRRVIRTQKGRFKVDMVRAELTNSKIKVVTDTGTSNVNCKNRCTTLPLKSYYKRNNAIAAINGTYFCPRDYYSCRRKTGWFFWRFYNSRIKQWFNPGNGYTREDGLFVFDANNKATYWHHANTFNTTRYETENNVKIQAGVGGAELVRNKRVSIRFSRLDSKQRNTKGNRGAIGVKGTAVYLVIIRSATVVDAAYVMRAMGVDNAINLDGGGSSALIFNGSYRIGPGRSVPNAIIIGKK